MITHTLAHLQAVGKVDEEGFMSGSAFINEERLVSISLPMGVVGILDGEYYISGCFSGCINLKEVTLPSSLTCIGTGARF